MSLLILIAVISAAATVILTLWAAFHDSRVGGQSMRESIIESWTNIGVGFSVNFTANLLILPLAYAEATAGKAFLIGVVFTGISVIRQFIIRRWFNRRTVLKSTK